MTTSAPGRRLRWLLPALMVVAFLAIAGAVGLLYRPYGLYYSGSSFFPGQLTAAAENNLVAQMWNFARPYSKRAEAANTWELFDSENHDAQAESFYFLAAQTFKNRSDYKNKKYADGSTVAQQYAAWRTHWSQYFDERAKRGLFVEAGAPSYQSWSSAGVGLYILTFSLRTVVCFAIHSLSTLKLCCRISLPMRSIAAFAQSGSFS